MENEGGENIMEKHNASKCTFSQDRCSKSGGHRNLSSIYKGGVKTGVGWGHAERALLNSTYWVLGKSNKTRRFVRINDVREWSSIVTRKPSQRVCLVEEETETQNTVYGVKEESDYINA